MGLKLLFCLYLLKEIQIQSIELKFVNEFPRRNLLKYFLLEEKMSEIRKITQVF